MHAAGSTSQATATITRGSIHCTTLADNNGEAVTAREAN
jgi:hypothetical protein